MPGGANPAKKVERYREPAPKIRFLTLEQIDEQLAAIEEAPRLQTIVAMYIYAGLRREEALWLTTNDVDLTAGRHGVIRVRAKTVLGESWEPKTKVNRAVPISSVLKVYLERYTPASPRLRAGRQRDLGCRCPAPSERCERGKPISTYACRFDVGALRQQVLYDSKMPILTGVC